MKNILITGVSTGIGAATADICVKQGNRVFGTVRQESDALNCAAKWGALFVPLIIDLKADSYEGIFENTKQVLNGAPLHVLINNAGVAKPGPMEVQNIDEIREMFEINFFAAVKMVQTFLPLLKQNSNFNSKIVNISSIAGKISAPFLGGYAASKHAIEGYSNSLRKELMSYGIKVVIVGPGNVRTPIWNKAAQSKFAKTPYEEPFNNFMSYALEEEQKGMQAVEIGQLIWEIIEDNNPKTRYAPIAQKVANWYVPRLMPSKMLDKLIFKMIGMKDLTKK